MANDEIVIPPGEWRNIDGMKCFNHGPEPVYIGKNPPYRAYALKGESTVEWREKGEEMSTNWFLEAGEPRKFGF